MSRFESDCDICIIRYLLDSHSCFAKVIFNFRQCMIVRQIKKTYATALTVKA